MTFAQYYADTPTSDLDKNQRQWFHPVLSDMYRKHSVYRSLIPYAHNLGAVNAKTMTLTQLIDIHPNFDTIGLRDIWLPSSHLDSRNQEITFNRYAGKVAYHEYDDIITYWQQAEGQTGQRGVLASILQGQLGRHYVDVHDALVRNAYLSGQNSIYQGTATDFSGIATTDTFDLGVIDDMWLGFAYRDTPMASDPNLAMNNSGQLIMITSPGVVDAIIRSAATDEWKTAINYAASTQLLKYEIGMYKNVRIVATPKQTLYNCGTIIQQHNVTVAVSAGDGSPDPDIAGDDVQGVYKTGQSGATHGITLNAVTGLVVNDIVSIHTVRTNAYGVTNGASYLDGKKTDRRIVKIDGSVIYFDLPVMVDFTTDLGGGVYAYVTKARHIHASTFIAGPDGVVGGVGRPAAFRNPGPVDDVEQVFRFSWNEYVGYTVLRPDLFDTYYTAARVRVVGDAVIQ